MMRRVPLPYIAAGAAVAAALAWAVTRPGAARDLGAAIGSGAVDLADGVIGGVVVTVGEAVGIPATSQTECERAKAEGRTWDASFACPAGDFLRYVWN